MVEISRAEIKNERNKKVIRTVSENFWTTVSISTLELQEPQEEEIKRRRDKEKNVSDSVLKTSHTWERNTHPNPGSSEKSYMDKTRETNTETH